eukprot:6470878-Amphidinium_carterae.1
MRPEIFTYELIQKYFRPAGNQKRWDGTAWGCRARVTAYLDLVAELNTSPLRSRIVHALQTTACCNAVSTCQVRPLAWPSVPLSCGLCTKPWLSGIDVDVVRMELSARSFATWRATCARSTLPGVTGPERFCA